MDVLPVLLGAGLRLLEGLDPAALRPEKTAVHEVGARTSLRLRVSYGA